MQERPTPHPICPRPRHAHATLACSLDPDPLVRGLFDLVQAARALRAQAHAAKQHLVCQLPLPAQRAAAGRGGGHRVLECGVRAAARSARHAAGGLGCTALVAIMPGRPPCLPACTSTARTSHLAGAATYSTRPPGPSAVIGPLMLFMNHARRRQVAHRIAKSTCSSRPPHPTHLNRAMPLCGATTTTATTSTQHTHPAPAPGWGGGAGRDRARAPPRPPTSRTRGRPQRVLGRACRP